MQDSHFLFERVIDANTISILVEDEVGKYHFEEISLVGVDKPQDIHVKVKAIDFIDKQLCGAVRSTLRCQDGHIWYRLPGEDEEHHLNQEIKEIVN